MEYPEHIERLLGHTLLADAEYRIWLCTDPIAAAASIGVTLSEKEADYIKANVTRRRLNGVARSVAHWKPSELQGVAGQGRWQEPKKNR